MSFSRHLSRIAGATAIAAVTGLVLSSGSAWADNPLAPKTTFNMVVDPATGLTNTPTDGESVPNVDSVKSTIRAYYNATNGIASKTSSRYITQVHAIENQILRSLPASHAPRQAVVFDMDDTLLWTYDYTDAGSNFNYDPTTNAQAVAAGFPAVPGMPQLLQTLKARGYLLYGVTGRPTSQKNDTLSNLSAQGFAVGGTALFTGANLYTKDSPLPTYVDCNADGNSACSTVEYKSFTRAHIKENGTPTDTTDDLDIVMNVGDQWSDLQGGNADDWTKVPNPAYFLPSPDIPGAPSADANMVPPTSYVMQPDGSSGYSVGSGDDIPNIDPVRKMVRAYYGAIDSNGVANKTASPYISQLSSLESSWTKQVTTDCAAKSQAYTAALAAQNAARAEVAAYQVRVAQNERHVAKAKKKLAKATSPADRRKARKRLAKAKKVLAAHTAALAAAEQQLARIALPAQPAVVFDADDTTLWNYDLEDSVMHFVYNPTTAATWITGHLFPAVPGMIPVVQAARTAGCTIYGLTGRPASQQADTIANLTEKGYVDPANQPLFTAAHYYTKDTANQPWVDCGSDGVCSTIEYKSGTRAHIESLGYDIVDNFGDQYSDLIGGYADHVYKVPNPTYYLP